MSDDGQDVHRPLCHGSAHRAWHADHSEEIPVMDQAFWEAHYGSADAIWSGRPNPHLVSEIGVGDRSARGRALDVGAGEGADAIWLAQHGWQIDAVDISAVALARGRARADSLGPNVTERITWTQADLLTHPPEPAAYDLVSMHYMQLPPADRDRVFPACIDAVAPGGALLVVAHHAKDMQTRGVSPSFAAMFYTAEQVAESLDDSWTVQVRETRRREGADPDGQTVTFYDTVLLARRGDTDTAG